MDDSGHTQDLWDPLLSELTLVITVPEILMLQSKALITVVPSDRQGQPEQLQ